MIRELGYNTQQTDARLSRIRKTIHFVKKDEDEMVQIADACAFGMRRYFSRLQFGDEFMHAIAGGLPKQEDYAGTLPLGLCSSIQKKNKSDNYGISRLNGRSSRIYNLLEGFFKCFFILIATKLTGSLRNARIASLLVLGFGPRLWLFSFCHTASQ